MIYEKKEKSFVCGQWGMKPVIKKTVRMRDMRRIPLTSLSRTDFADIQIKKNVEETDNGKYERQGDYLILCLTVPAEEEQPIGTWG